MHYMLLIPCYSSIRIDDRILTGVKGKGGQIGDSFSIQCKCSSQDYHKECVFSDIGDFIPKKEEAFTQLKGITKAIEAIPPNSILTGMGHHHNRVQNDAKKFRVLSDLSADNSRVLKLFGKLGLSKIVFGAQSQKGFQRTGTMSMNSVRKCENHDIVEVKFSAETGFVMITELYFPTKVGKLVHDYFEKDVIDYKSVLELLERLNVL